MVELLLLARGGSFNDFQTHLFSHRDITCVTILLMKEIFVSTMALYILIIIISLLMPKMCVVIMNYCFKSIVLFNIKKAMNKVNKLFKKKDPYLP